MKKITIFINYLTNSYYIKNKIVLCFKKKILTIFISKLYEKIKINKNNNILEIKGLLESKEKFLKKINNLVKNINTFEMIKLNFNGKGFKIKKLYKTCFFLFNKSHRCIYIYKNTICKKINKNIVICINKIKKLNNLKENIINIFPLNNFTKKGLRINSQIVKIKKK
jgi:hypothetical protein